MLGCLTTTSKLLEELFTNDIPMTSGLANRTWLHLTHNIGVTKNTVQYQDISLLAVKLHNLHSSIANLLSTQLYHWPDELTAIPLVWS